MIEFVSGREYFAGEFSLPGDKSITHRAIMLNGGAEGESLIQNALMGEDCLSTCRCMRALGAKIDIDGTTLRVHGTPRFRRGTELNCGNSGTTIRLLTGFVAGKGVDAMLYGDASLSTRPMQRVSNPLALLGANVRTTEGHAPVYVSPAQLEGAQVQLKIASAQVKSALLLAGISAEGKTTVTEPLKSRDHTERILRAMGANVAVEGNTVSVEKSVLSSVDVCV
ncbi:MAG: 3-phosphoshikimate 1-carboxyvinyltransferase, partial [Clostridia bacterium]|nr:3-phosphoshikimate 1-carboxyvinyltransferase [Clostridia bacterium]